jgi:hypothetical protein
MAAGLLLGVVLYGIPTFLLGWWGRRAFPALLVGLNSDSSQAAMYTDPLLRPASPLSRSPPGASHDVPSDLSETAASATPQDPPADQSRISAWRASLAQHFRGDLARTVGASFGIWVSVLTIVIHAVVHGPFESDTYIVFPDLWMLKMTVFQSVFSALCIISHIFVLRRPSIKGIAMFVDLCSFILRAVCACLSLRYCLDFMTKTRYMHDPAYRAFDLACFSDLIERFGGLDASALVDAKVVEWTSGLLLSLAILQFCALTVFFVGFHKSNHGFLPVLVAVFCASWLALPVYASGLAASHAYLSAPIPSLWVPWIFGIVRVVTCLGIVLLPLDPGLSALGADLLFLALGVGGFWNFFGLLHCLPRMPYEYNADQCPGIFDWTVLQVLRGFGIYELVLACVGVMFVAVLGIPLLVLTFDLTWTGISDWSL